MTITQIRSTDGTGTLSYLISDEENKVAAAIDPNIEDVKNFKVCAAENRVKITHIIDTHTHADHVSGSGELKEIYGSEIYMHTETKNKMKVLENAAKFGIEDILKANAAIKVDHFVNDGDIIEVGSIKIKVIHSPGHTDNHITLLIENNLFTGDLLLIGQAGRSDLPGGNTEDQYDTLFNKIIPLGGNIKIYPGHDYEDNEFAYLKDELKNNPFLLPRSKKEYVEFVKDFFPPFAENTSEGGKMTLQCGVKRVTKSDEGFKSINVDELAEMINENKELFLLDVREPFELIMGKVNGIKNIPIGELPRRLSELPDDKSKEIVCICATGSRSYEASDYLYKKGYKNVINLEGGTYAWFNGGYELAGH